MASLVSDMKHLKGADFAAQMDSWEGIHELLAELWVSWGPGGSAASTAAGGILPRRALAWVPGV